jgi:hypothetical protein
MLESTDEIRRQGIEALAAALGPVDAVRFLQIFELEKGITLRIVRNCWTLRSMR